MHTDYRPYPACQLASSCDNGRFPAAFRNSCYFMDYQPNVLGYTPSETQELVYPYTHQQYFLNSFPHQTSEYYSPTSGYCCGENFGSYQTPAEFSAQLTGDYPSIRYPENTGGIYPSTAMHHFYNESRLRSSFFAIPKLKQKSSPLSCTKKKYDDEQCKVCGANSSGFHFGVFTCEACKGFFRRYSRKQHHITPCPTPCEINVSNRNNCPACRFSKCKAVGMAIENIRYGKPPRPFRCSKTTSSYSTVETMTDEILIDRLVELYNATTFLSVEDVVEYQKRVACILNQPNQTTAETANASTMLSFFLNKLSQQKQETLFCDFNDHKTKILMGLLIYYRDDLLNIHSSSSEIVIRLIETHFKDDRMSKILFFTKFLYIVSFYN